MTILSLARRANKGKFLSLARRANKGKFLSLARLVVASSSPRWRVLYC
jgi:hypothetical protein